MQHLLIGLIDFPPLLQLRITMLDSGIAYLNHYTVSQRCPPPPAGVPPLAGPLYPNKTTTIC